MSWQALVVAAERTHHLVGGKPAYQDRFDDVLPFHAPGLAPVRRGLDSWHIDVDGNAAYEARFLRTFGFYEGRAAVVGLDGWHHVLADGRALAPNRYAWCGNFQFGRCTVRRRDERYVHLDHDGLTVYDATWRYAGDYREGIAVVQADDGSSSHIDLAGGLVHGRWFVDLDVFHKGFARARDERGWHHVDRAGVATYERRFAAVEPFYNGQARVERHDGGLEVIDEVGATLVELRPGRRGSMQAVSADLVGYWRTRTLAAAAQLRVLDALPATALEVVERCGLSGPNAPRLLRALAELGTVEKHGEVWQPTVRGEVLREDHPTSLRGAAIEYATTLVAPWEHLVEALRAERWAPDDPFEAAARDPARARRHHQMLRSYARNDYGALVSAMALRGDETIIDAGGGLGVVAESLLAAHQAVRVVLLERAEVIDQLDLRDARLDAVAMNIFEPWKVHGDAVVLARVLHDWDDERALTILRHARAALSIGGHLFVVDMVLDESDHSGGLVDLHLLVVSGGRERTAGEFASLFEHAGFTLRSISPLDAIPSLIVGVAR